VNAAINRLIAVNAAAARIFDGRASTVISDGHIAEKALRRVGQRRSEIDTRYACKTATTSPTSAAGASSQAGWSC